MTRRRGESVVLHRLGPWWARNSALLTRLRRHPAAHRAARHRLGAAAMAAVVALVTFHLAVDARHLRDGWGRTVPVAVTTRAVTAGELLDGAVRLERRPAAVVADGASPTLPAPGRRAAHRLPARRELVAGDSAPPGRGPLAAKLPPGTAGVTLRPDGSAPPVAPGDRVDVVATTTGTLDAAPFPEDPGPPDADPADGADRRTTEWPRLARLATVLEVGDGTVTVAVDEAEAVATAAAAATGGATLVVRR